MRIVFFGTPEIAAGVLSAVIAAGHDVCLAVTRADKPSGRGHKLIPSPVKSLALGHGIDVYQPSGIRSPEALEYLRSMKADMFLTVAPAGGACHTAARMRERTRVAAAEASRSIAHQPRHHQRRHRRRRYGYDDGRRH